MKISSTSLYASVGAELRRYTLDIDSGGLSLNDAIALPYGLQYAWPSKSGEFLYGVASDGKPGYEGDQHTLLAVRTATGSQQMAMHGGTIALPRRPIHVTLDNRGEYLVVTFPFPSGIAVFRIERDGTVGEQIPQREILDLGIVGHQFRFTPDGSHAVLVTRGNSASGTRPEEPGALKSFRYQDGQLANLGSSAPGGGFGFGPRHIDFHPSGKWIYAALERQNQMWVFGLQDGLVSQESLYRMPMLAHPEGAQPRQLVGTIHMHPNGRTVYAANRADGTVDHQGQQVFNDGENTIAVFAINQSSGEPTLLERADTHGIHARTFHIDPSGRFLVAANMKRGVVRRGETLNPVPAGLAVLRIEADGRLTFLHSVDVDVGSETIFWMGVFRSFNG